MKVLFTMNEQKILAQDQSEQCEKHFSLHEIKNCILLNLLVYMIIILTSCGIPNRSVMKGTYGDENFVLKGKIGTMSRHVEWIDCSQSISFYPAYPVGDQLNFTFGLKDIDMYEGFQEQIDKNLLSNLENRIDKFYILGYTNKEIEIDIGDSPEGDFFIIHNVALKNKGLRNSPFEELNKAVVIKGKMKLHFDEIMIDSDFEFVFGQCYQ